MNMAKKVKENSKAVNNFMNGISYKVNPLETLKIVTASSIFGEPQYYRRGEFAEAKIRDGIFKSSYLPLLKDDLIFKDFDGKKTSDIMEEVIDNSLDFDFDGTLKWAKELRTKFNMRLNPQIIMVRASIHSKRKGYTQTHKGEFDKINQIIMSRADEPASQLTYWLYKNNNKNKIPSILKRSWAKKLSSTSRYELYKYKNKGIGLIDTIRICHANSKYIDELMKTGTIEIEQNKTTWEALRSEGKGWNEIINTIDIQHMALLRNLRGIFTEIDNREATLKLLDKLKLGVLKGKQFPFRYFSAIKAIQNSNVYNKILICDTLEECIDISTSNLPKLAGKTICLSDNSGSAWGTFNSEYGSVTIAEIDNLSSVITAFNSDEGYVGKFGDKIEYYPILKRNGILNQAQTICADGYKKIGGNTENGIWLFFSNAIKNKEHWDNIFIYSDQQAGHGGLYGINSSEYSNYRFDSKSKYIDIYKLICEYRKINPNVNVFSIQTAGYNNVLVPENCYRTSILYGWTGKELIYADIINTLWDNICNNKV